MRDVLHIGCLFFVFAFLMTRFPTDVPTGQPSPPPAPFAAFVTFSPAAHAAQLEAARTSWQVRSRARGRPSIGRLDADVPLLAETLPPPAPGVFQQRLGKPESLPEPDVSTYAFLPPTAGAEMPDFTIRAGRSAAVRPAERRTSHPPVFGKDEMLSLDGYRTLKELMK